MSYVKLNDCACFDDEVAAVINEKSATWDEIREDVENFVDKLGKSVDDGIRETVTAFQALGLPTIASCEGHIEYGCAYPWIDFEVQEPGESKIILLGKPKIVRQRLLLESRITDLLEEYYSARRVPYHAMLIIESFDSAYFRLRFAGGEISDVMGFDKRRERLKLYKAEMEAFTIYLKAKFFHG